MSLRVTGGCQTADMIDVWTRELLEAPSRDEAEARMKPLITTVVRQGSVYEAAEHFIDRCLDMMDRGVGGGPGIGHALDVIVEIVEGEPDPAEVSLDNGDLVERCRDAVRRRRSLLARLARSSDEFVVFGALELLAVVLPDQALAAELARDTLGREMVQRSAWTHDGFVLFREQLLRGEWH